MSNIEQKIMECWNIVDDIDVAVGAIHTGVEPLRVSMMLQGIALVYEQRFQSLFKEYEKSLKERHNAREDD